MPASFMDQMNFSPVGGRGSSESSSFFSEELLLPTEKQVGFCKPESVPDHCGKEGIPLFSGSKSVSSSPLKKLHPTGGTAQNIEVSQPYLNGDLKAKLNLDRQVMGLDRMSNLFVAPLGTSKSVATCGSYLLNQPATSSLKGSHTELSRTQFVNEAFPSILSDAFNKKLILSSNNLAQSIDTLNSNFEEDEPFESMEDIEAQTIGNLLPDDDDELLSGVVDDIGYNCRLASGVDFEDDIFYSGGGMELEAGEINGISASELIGRGFSNSLQGGLNGTYAGEHPFSEHPSRTLFVRNVNSSVEDTELKALFEQYGDISALYTACKHRGFVMISYYDIRSACNAMRALQNRPLRRRKLDIHFSIPKDNPSEKDINQGTLLVFNLDSSVSNEDLHHIFGVYGEIKEIGDTPNKLHHKFIEFYDVRAADAALRALNRSDIAGRKIKLEPSHPGGARCLVQQSSSQTEQDELNGRKPRSHNSSPSGFFGTVPLGVISTNSLETGGNHGLESLVRAPVSPFTESTFHGISSSVPHKLSSPIRITSVNNLNNQAVSSDLSHSLGQNFGLQGMPSFHPHSLPEYNNGVANGISYTLSNSISAMGMNIGPGEGIDNRHLNKVNSGSLNSNHNEGTFGTSNNGSCPVHGHQYVWNNTNAFKRQLPGPVVWSNSLPFKNTISARPPPQMHGIPRAPPHMMRTAMPSHHVGSAPTANPTLWDRRHIYNGDAADSPAFHPGSLGTIGFPGSPQFHQLELASRGIFHRSGGIGTELSISPVHVGIPSPQQRCQIYHGRNHHMLTAPGSFESSSDRMRSRRNDAIANQTDNKKQYELDIDRIVHSEDTRTTLMIKNIPNKYTSKMLLAAIDENHRGTYDFIYLPIDFKNKCNVGYAFINMTDPLHIVSFYQSINGKKWEKFNSEKVASLAYARIQGKGALIAHFQNSSLMNEDKRCRPILFHSEGPNAGDQEPFPMGINLRSRSGRSRTAGFSEEQHDGSPPASANEEAFCDISVSPGYTKDCE